MNARRVGDKKNLFCLYNYYSFLQQPYTGEIFLNNSLI